MRRRRRTFTARQRRDILREYDAAPLGKKAEVARRHQVQNSLLAYWRKNQQAATPAASRALAVRPPRPARELVPTQPLEGKPLGPGVVEELLRRMRSEAGVQIESCTVTYRVTETFRFPGLVRSIAEGLDKP